MIKYVLVCFLLFPMQLFAQLQVTNTLCENKINPSGIKTDKVRFSWELLSSKNNLVQTAYQLVIASSQQKLNTNSYDVYNSSIIKSNNNIMVEYAGKPLQPGKTYYWKLRVWDKLNKPSAWCNTQQFITALNAKDWGNAQWISYENFADSLRIVPGSEFGKLTGNKGFERMIVPYFRKTFTVEKHIKQALVFVTGLGQYEFEVNGIKVGNRFLAPGWSFYDKTILYNTYNITNLIQQGGNAFGIIAGNGFYNISKERYYKFIAAFGVPKIICKIVIYYTDGTTSNIVSDASWKTAASPITYSSMYGGEDYDANKEQKGWSAPNFDDAQWKHALIATQPKGKLVTESDFPVEIMDTITTKKIRKVKQGYLYDFGQNASGIVSVKVKGNKGDTIKLVPAELLDSTGMPDQNATGKPYYFTYILKGDSIETWQPRFTYYGFRYVWMQGATPACLVKNNEAKLLQLDFLHTRNSTSLTGSFKCSDTLFNKVYTLINWAIKSNIQSVVTDCPHREKLGWLEQTYLMGNSIQYNFNIQLLYQQLVHDMMDAQTDDGLVPDIAPEFVVFSDGFRDSPEWGSASIILPWLLYKWYDDKTTMSDAYTMMKKYLAYLEAKSASHILSYGLGDWYDYGPNFPGEAQLTPKAVTATSIYYYDALLLSKMAMILDKTNDADKFIKQAASIKQSFNNTFFSPKNNVYSTGSQTAMAMPLCVGLVDEQYKKAVLKNLIDSIYKNHKALTAGDIGFHFLIQALDEGGASQLIFDMNNRDDVAGYGFQLKKGATALTESWQALAEVSNNHLMLGHIMEWFYSGLGGIAQEENSVAYKIIKIRPQAVGNITSAEAKFHSPYGWITTKWEKENHNFLLQLQVPVNTTANVYLPAGSTAKIYKNDVMISNKDYFLKGNMAIVKTGSGKYIFEVKDTPFK